MLAHGPEVPSAAAPLDEGLALAARLGIGVQMDVKQRGVEEGVVDALRRHDLLDRSFVSSFSLPILRAFAAAERGCRAPSPIPRIASARPAAACSGLRCGPASPRCGRSLPVRLPRWLARAGARADDPELGGRDARGDRGLPPAWVSPSTRGR